MNSKSNILVQLEMLESAQRLKEYTEILLETYRIDDIVLGIVRGNPQEITTGYLREMKEYESVDKAVQNFNPNTDCIRVFEGKYFTGKWSKEPVQCEGQVLSVSDFRII